MKQEEKITNSDAKAVKQDVGMVVGPYCLVGKNNSNEFFKLKLKF